MTSSILIVLFTSDMMASTVFETEISGGVAKWFSTLELKSGGHWFKSSNSLCKQSPGQSTTSCDSKITYVPYAIFVSSFAVSLIITTVQNTFDT